MRIKEKRTEYFHLTLTFKWRVLRIKVDTHLPGTGVSKFLMFLKCSESFEKVGMRVGTSCGGYPQYSYITPDGLG